MRAVLVNPSLNVTRLVALRAQDETFPTATVARLTAPSAGSSTGMAFGGQYFPAATTTGLLAGRRRTIRLTANRSGIDLGTLTREIAAAVKRSGEAPKGAKVEIRGQVPPMNDMTSGLSAGPHLLVRQWPEAQLVTSAAEVIEAVGRIGELAPLPMPYAVRKDVDEAVSWVRERMAR